MRSSNEARKGGRSGEGPNRAGNRTSAVPTEWGLAEVSSSEPLPTDAQPCTCGTAASGASSPFGSSRARRMLQLAPARAAAGLAQRSVPLGAFVAAVSATP